MVTDFYQRQDAARRNTTWLVVLFAFAVIAIVATSFLLAMWAATMLMETQSRSGGRGAQLAQDIPEPSFIGLIAGGMSLALIGGGTLFKVVELRSGGGKSVAESVGGNRLYANSEAADRRQLLNVVEEMAIASGTAVPPVYLLDEDGINAFAAGYAPGDAVIGVTRGACEQLTRSELQGVIAHEFSHILNGDMRTNIRLIGILHGILLLSLIGQMLLQSLRFGGHGRRRRSSGGEGGGGKALLVILVLGVSLYLLGLIGSLIGGLIKAAVSRQREYLADASAVQFTRDPSGIAGALRQIGAGRGRSKLTHPNASVASHMYFAKGVFEGFSGLMATHPPLDKRILAIEPSWDGTFPPPRTTTAAREQREPQMASFSGSAFAAQAAAEKDGHGGQPSPELVFEAATQVGHPADLHRRYAAMLLAELPPVLLDAARDGSSARAVVIAMLLHHDGALRQSQLAKVRERLGDFCAGEAERFRKQLQGKTETEHYRLPLLDLTLPALASMSARQYDQFAATIEELSRADQQISLFEWTLVRVLMRRLKPQFRSVRSPRIRYYGLSRLSDPISTLISVMARVGHHSDQVAAAFRAGQAALTDVEVRLLPPEHCNLDRLSASLDELLTVAIPKRGEVINACAKTICADKKVTVGEGELLRGVADLLDCPIPPLVAATAIRQQNRPLTTSDS